MEEWPIELKPHAENGEKADEEESQQQERPMEMKQPLPTTIEEPPTTSPTLQTPSPTE